MRRMTLALTVGAIATTSIFAATAAGSGPAPPGKETVEINCAGLGTVTVSVPRPEKSRGAGQIVGQKDGVRLGFANGNHSWCGHKLKLRSRIW